MTQEAYLSSLESQGVVLEALCAENVIGRWIWKSGDVLAGYAVPWEVQSVNTCPDNFIWEKNNTNILAAAPGLYQISAGVFGKRKPSVHILVNGETFIQLNSDCP